MEQPVDIASLRSITGGDTELESELFRSFLASSQDCLQGLREAIKTQNPNAWRDSAHAFKGICLNLGAGPLAELCKQAQDGFQGPTENKKLLMTAIEGEYGRVRAVVEGMIVA